jgi:hypothetical protein
MVLSAERGEAIEGTGGEGKSDDLSVYVYKSVYILYLHQNQDCEIPLPTLEASTAALISHLTEPSEGAPRAR